MLLAELGDNALVLLVLVVRVAAVPVGAWHRNILADRDGLVLQEWIEIPAVTGELGLKSSASASLAPHGVAHVKPPAPRQLPPSSFPRGTR